MQFESYIGEKGTKVYIDFDYDPGQPPIYYPNDKAQPGFAPEVEITAVSLSAADDADNLIDSISDGEIDRFVSECWEWIRQQKEDSDMFNA